jgi:hypothetical protein
MPDRTKRAAPVAALALLALTACQATKDAAVATMNTPVATAQGLPTVASADSDMAAVLLALQALGPKPIETLSAEEARRQPTPADAIEKYLADRGQSTSPMPKVSRTSSSAWPPSSPTRRQRRSSSTSACAKRSRAGRAPQQGPEGEPVLLPLPSLPGLTRGPISERVRRVFSLASEGGLTAGGPVPRSSQGRT